MDILQIALVLLIILLGVLLSILGLQVFLILRDLKKSLDKLDLVLGDAQNIAEDIQKPVHAAAEVVEAVESGVKAVKTMAGKTSKPAKRLFKRH